MDTFREQLPMPTTTFCWGFTAALAVFFLAIQLPAADVGDDRAAGLAREILDATGVRSGLVVLCGCPGCRFASATRSRFEAGFESFPDFLTTWPTER
jgi:hypothetical protein